VNQEESVVVELGSPEPSEQTEPSDAVAVWLGIRMELPSGRSFAVLMCSDDQNGGAWFVEGVQGPSDDEADGITCSRCGTRHSVISLVDAIERDLVNITEATIGIMLNTVVALWLRDLEKAAKRR
jgi:hypothetical protein